MNGNMSSKNKTLQKEGQGEEERERGEGGETLSS
jgi:hypothetical protein